MPYVGNPLADAFSSREKQDLTGQSGTSFTLTHSVSHANDLSVYINHVRQEPTTAYTVNGTTLTTTGSVAGTDDFYIIYDELALQSISHPSDQAMTATSGTFTSGLVGTTATFSGAVSGTTGTFSGDVNIDSKLFNIDSSNNRIGINTNSIAENDAAKMTINADNTGAIIINNTGQTNGEFAPILFTAHASNTAHPKQGIGVKRTGDFGVGDLVFAVDSNADAEDVSMTNDAKMTISQAGNVGIGITPESHHANWTAIDIGDQGGLAHYDGGATSLSTNLYHDGAWKAKETGTSSRIEIGADGYVNIYSGASASADAAVTLTKRLAIQPDGDVNVHTGNLVLGTNGKGIDFAFNSNVSGMTSELLDDYEEGTATVNMVSSGATFAFGGSDGSETTLYYIKIGRLVHYFMNWDSSSTVSGTTSNAAQIQNLPFSSDYGDTFTTWFHRGAAGAVDILATAYGTSMSFITSPTGGGMWSDMTAASLSHVDMRLRVSGTTIVS